jgi:hypothetical protein
MGIDNGERGAADLTATGSEAVTTSGVSAQLCITDHAALVAFDWARPGTPGSRHNNSRRGICAGAPAIYRQLLDNPEPSFGFVMRGGKVHLRGELSDTDAAADVLRRVSSPWLQDVRDIDRSTLESAIGEDQRHTFYFGHVR